MSLTYSLCYLKMTNNRINRITWSGVKKRSDLFVRLQEFLGAYTRKFDETYTQYNC